MVFPFLIGTVRTELFVRYALNLTGFPFLIGTVRTELAMATQGNTEASFHSS